VRNATKGGHLKNSTLHLNVPTFKAPVGASVTASPAAFGNAVLVPSWDGRLRAINRKTGNELWTADVGRAYYGATSNGTKVCNTSPALWDRDFALVGTMHPADLLMVRIRDGSLVWLTRLDDHPMSVVGGSGTVRGDVLFVGTDSTEKEYSDANPTYHCCSFVGSLIAVELRRGEIIWKTRSICANVSGAGNFSGAPFRGSTPPVSVPLNLVYATTGHNYNVSATYANCTNSTPPQNVSKACDLPYYPCNYPDSVLAFDLTNGSIVWTRKLRAWDSWNATCGPNVTNTSADCPLSPSGYSEFGMNPALDYWCHVPFGELKKRIQVPLVCSPALFVAQENGALFNLDATNGTINWANQTSPPGPSGGSTTGLAVDDLLVYLGVVNSAHLNWTLVNGSVIGGGGWAAHYKSNGSANWTTANPAYYDPSGNFSNSSSNGRSATSGGVGAPLSIEGVVLVTSADAVYVPDYGTGVPVYGSGGWVYALRKTDGAIMNSFQTLAGTTASFSPGKECVYVGSGSPGGPNGTFVFGWCINR
jgi:polyvinyl alcohol dehydrogenase (cytochrome)